MLPLFFVILMLVLSIPYWLVIIVISAPLNLILFRKFDKKRFKFVFISCCLPYLTLLGTITRRGSSNIFINPICLALIMIALEEIYLLTGKCIKSYNHNIALNILYLLTSFVAVILFTIYMPDFPE